MTNATQTTFAANIIRTYTVRIAECPKCFREFQVRTADQITCGDAFCEAYLHRPYMALTDRGWEDTR